MGRKNNKKVEENSNKEQNSTILYYTIKKGDKLSEIASRYGTTELNLIKLNKLENPSLLKLGEKIRLS